MIAAGIEYAQTGAGPPLVCLHGIGGGLDSFARQSDPALGGFRVIAWNMPGYGRSRAFSHPATFAALSDALAGFLDALALKRVHLLGQSIGGMLALDHAIRRPDQVATLTLIGTTPSFGGRDASFGDAFLKARLAPLDAGQTMPELAAQSARRIVGPMAGPEVVAAVEGPLSRVPEATWRDILQCLVTFNRRDDLGRVTQPCCLIAGEHDQNAPARTMARMAENLADAEYHLIDGAGHMINQEAPGATNDIVANFLGRHPI